MFKFKEKQYMSERQYRDVLSFLCIAFLLPLISVYLQILIPNSTVKFLLYGIEAAAPSIATIIITAKNRDVRGFFDENFRTKGMMWAVILPVVIAGCTMFLAKIMACFLLKEHLVLCSISTTQMIIVLWALVAEELGWRGYLYPFLCNQMKQSYLAPLFVGVIWGVWHYHYFWFGEMEVPPAWFLMGCIVESYIYSNLLKWSNDNLFSAMIYHFAWNLFVHVFAINPVDNRGNSLPYIILIVLETLFCFFTLKHNERTDRVYCENKK